MRAARRKPTSDATDATAGSPPPCPICKMGGTVEFFRAEGVPVFCNVTLDTPEEARAAARGNIRLRFCRGCGYIHNTAFEPALMTYNAGYENALHFSPRFRRYAEELAADLIRRLDLRGRKIIEVGCGDGYFLGMLCRMGPNTGIGFDPSYRSSDAPDVRPGRVSFRAEYYGPAHAKEQADLVCCRQVLEHLPDPLAFLVEMRHTMGPRKDAHLFCEVPNGLYMLQENAFWDVLYEHCSYLLPSALNELFLLAGFAPVSTEPTYQGQFLSILARPAEAGEAHRETDRTAGEEIVLLVDRFAESFRQKLADWQSRLGRMRDEGKRVVFWGAGTKGAVLLNALERSGELVGGIVDINPRKRGKFIPGTAHRIVCPEDLRSHPPDAIVAMNPIYIDEIRRMVEGLGIGTEILPV